MSVNTCGIDPVRRISRVFDGSPAEIQVYRTVCAVPMNRRPLTALTQPGRDVDNHPVGPPCRQPLPPPTPLPATTLERFPDGQTTVKRNTAYGGQTTRFRDESLFYFFSIRLQNKKNHTVTRAELLMPGRHVLFHFPYGRVFSFF